jgi:hypothetical protein
LRVEVFCCKETIFIFVLVGRRRILILSFFLELFLNWYMLERVEDFMLGVSRA